MDESEVRRWFDVFKEGHELVEIRLAEPGRKGMMSGYFTDADTLVDAIRPYDRCAVYFTVNSIKDACYERMQKDQIVQYPKETTSDNDILGREWLFVDIDPERPSGTNATDEEVRRAMDVGNNVYTFLRNNGFSEPVCAFSGNGVHLHYRVRMKNSDANRDTVRDFLQVLDMLFSTEEAKVDTTTYNAARIAKLYGTFSRKGNARSKDRPQRMSRIVRVPDELKVNRNEFVEKVAAMLPKREAPNRYNNYDSRPFDLEDFIREHGIEVVKECRFGNGTKYVLSECPFDGNHKAPDAALFRMDSGAVGFKCFHNSCSSYTWHDFRMHFDPQAYDRKALYEHRQKVWSNTATGQTDRPKDDAPQKTAGKRWLSMADIEWVDPSSLPFVPTGIMGIDRKMMGLMMGDVSIVSGLSGAGKTSLIDWVALNVVNKGYKVAIWSGELQGFRFQSWMDQIAAGKNNVKRKEGYDNLYFAPRSVCDRINAWLEGKMWLYNNDYGNKWSQLFNDVREVVDREDISLVILDNLMSMNIEAYEGNQYERQTKFINDLKEYAKKRNIHVVLVAHPRKEQSFQLLRMESISGTADLVNLSDNLFLIHRVGKDFYKRASEFWGEETVNGLMDYDVVLEVAKNRSAGCKDTVVGLYYENESRRLKNDMAEYTIYGWDEAGQLPPYIEPVTDVEEFEDDGIGDFPDLPEYMTPTQ